jgi:CheY-like chemotaxis protein
VARPKVVVVEDDAEVRDLELFLLESEGYEVRGVGDGVTALSVIQREKPDVVLLDLMLPGQDGNALLAQMATDPNTSAVRVIVVSAYTQRLRPSQLVKRVIAKPFDLPRLLEAVAQEVSHGAAPHERAR